MPRLTPRPEPALAGPPDTLSPDPVAEQDDKPVVYAVITPDTIYAHPSERWKPRPYFILKGVLDRHTEFFTRLTIDELFERNGRTAFDVRPVVDSNYHPQKQYIFGSEQEARVELARVFQVETAGTIELSKIEVHEPHEEQAYLAFRESQKEPLIRMKSPELNLFGTIFE